MSTVKPLEQPKNEISQPESKAQRRCASPITVRMADGTKFAVGAVEQLKWLKQVQQDRALSYADIAIAVALVRFVNNRAGYAFPSNSTLAEVSRVSDRSVRRRVSALIERGHLLQKRRRRQSAALYLVLQDRTEIGPSYVDQDRKFTG